MTEPLQFFQERMCGQPMDLMRINELRETFQGSERQKGNFNAFGQRAEDRVEQQQVERVAKAGAELASRAQRISETTTDLQRQADDIFDALDRGQMEVKEARQLLAKIKQEHRMLHDQIAQLKADQQAAAALADMSAAEFEQSYLATTPALRRSLPVLTLDILNEPPTG